jgi:hypothetical protein
MSYTQPAPHTVEPPRQLTPHVPAEHAWPIEHGIPQPPQLAGSFFVSILEGLGLDDQATRSAAASR